ncbi:hypothetical protein CRG98_014985 [Punica granatum]|uniref:Uncharacterized protein n=1 Tax=Punica granatum TaxID=22663 RepID=A0A2I0K8W2_PUNGR|nr:hypothetical protein CRG98_014985 [Punica granatum]
MQDRGPIWDRSPMRSRSPKVGPKPDEGPKPKSRPEGRCSKSGAEARCSKCGVGARCRAKARCGAGTQCSKCVLDKEVQKMRKERCKRPSPWKAPVPGEGLVELVLIAKLLILLGDLPAEMISFGSEMSELGLDGHIWSGSCAGLEIPLIKSRMLGEVWTLGNHSSPCIQDLFDVTLAICRCLILPPSMFKSRSSRILGDRLGSSYPSVACSQDAVEGPDGLSHEGYLITTPSDHLENNAGQGSIDKTMRARE